MSRQHPVQSLRDPVWSSHVHGGRPGPESLFNPSSALQVLAAPCDVAPP